MTVPDDWEPIDLRDLFKAIAMMISIVAGLLVSVALLICVDLPLHRVNDRAGDSEATTADLTISESDMQSLYRRDAYVPLWSWCLPWPKNVGPKTHRPA